MASLTREATIEAAAADCWDALRDFGAVHERLARGFVTAATMRSERDREVTFSFGAVAVERLVGIDDERMRLVYTVVEGPLGAEHYNAAAQVVPLGEGRCRFVWTIDLLPDELADRVGQLMDAGLKAIVATLSPE